jgi:tetratricopeptide (TPR) repeat protein
MALANQFLLTACPLALLVGTCLPASTQVAAPRGQRDEAAQHAQRGLEFARAGQLDRAEAELREATGLAPSDPDVLAALGTVLAQEQKLEESTAVFKRALQLNPDNLTVRRYLAANLWQLHRYGEARDSLQIILKRKPDDEAAQLLLGMVSENMGDYAAAARLLAVVPDEVRKQPESVAALVRSYYHLGQTEKARETLMQLTSHPAGAPALFLGAQIADEMQDYSTAEKLLTSIPLEFLGQARVQYTLALVKFHAGEFDQSQHILDALMSSGTGSGTKTAAIYNLLGWCHQKQGRPKEALQALQESITLAPAEETNYLDLTKILLAQHVFPPALQAATRTTDTFPSSAAAFELRGMVEMGMGQFTDAIRSYTQAMQRDASRPDGILGLAQAQYAAGMAKDAADNFETGLQRFPRDVRFKTQYASMLLRQSETGEVASEARAQQLLRSALTLDPSLSDAHYQLGNLALKKDRMAEAQQHLERAVRLDANNAAAHFALARVYRHLGRRTDAAHEMDLYESLKPTEPGKDNSPGAPPQSQERSRP